MKIRLLLILVIIIGFSALALLFLVDTPSESNISDGREDLKEVAYSNNICSKTYRVEFFAMLDDQNYDYKNDPIFQECSKVLEIEQSTNTTYVPSLKQLKAILEYCIDSKDLVDTTGLSYSNATHYIDSINCEWELISGKIVTGSYELEDPLCIGGRGMIKNENCEIIGKYDPATGMPIVENKEQCDMLEGDWDEEQKICDSKYGGK